MKQNQFIQSCMQNYMKNCQHYLTGEKNIYLINVKIFGNIYYSCVYQLWA